MKEEMYFKADTSDPYRAQIRTSHTDGHRLKTASLVKNLIHFIPVIHSFTARIVCLLIPKHHPQTVCCGDGFGSKFLT